MDIVSSSISAPLVDFSIEQYSSNYEGYGRIHRLVFLAEKTKQPPNDHLQLASLIKALEETKKTLNTSFYVEIAKKIGGNNYDRSWVEATDKKAQLLLEKLENDLNSAKTSMAKENIRQAHIELGKYYSDRGDLNLALRSFMRSRDYCTNKTIVPMCLQVIRTSLHMGSYVHIPGFISKAEAALNQLIFLQVMNLKWPMG